MQDSLLATLRRGRKKRWKKAKKHKEIKAEEEEDADRKERVRMEPEVGREKRCSD